MRTQDARLPALDKARREPEALIRTRTDVLGNLWLAYRIACHAGLPRTAGSRAGPARTLRLNRRTRYRAVGTEHATIALLRLKHPATAGAFIKEAAGIGRHGFRFCGGAVRAGDDGFKDHGISLNHITEIRISGRIGQHRRYRCR